MIDTHCHVHFRAYDDNREEVLKRTREKGVRMITIGTQSDTSRLAIEAASNAEDIWATVGLHPSHTHKHTLHIDEEESITTRAEVFDKDLYRGLIESSDKVVAIGEVGLDYYRLPEQGADEVIEAQKEALWAALELASEMGLPVILHVRHAFDDVVELLEKAIDEGLLEKRGVVHCFTGTRAEAEKYHELGFLTSITAIVTFKDRKDPDKLTDLMRTVRDLPLEMLMIETDAPYLAPQEYRGKQCEPWMVESVAKKIAELKGVSVDEVVKVSDENAHKLFGIPRD